MLEAAAARLQRVLRDRALAGGQQVEVEADGVDLDTLGLHRRACRLGIVRGILVILVVPAG